MSALVQQSADLVKVPESAALARELPSNVLFQLEAAGQLATEILDERVIQWTDEGWTQQEIANELGCDQRTAGRRQDRLGVTPSSPRGRPRRELGTAPNSDGAEVVDGEPVPDKPRKPTPRPADPDRAAHYLPDLVSEDADFHLRTQALNWFDQGQRLQRLLSSPTPLTVRSDEDRTAMEKEAADMARLADRLKEAIHNAAIN